MYYINSIAIALIINHFVGIFILCLTDGSEALLYKWYKSCPSWWVQVFTIQCWPMIVWYYRGGNHEYYNKKY